MPLSEAFDLDVRRPRATDGFDANAPESDPIPPEIEAAVRGYMDAVDTFVAEHGGNWRVDFTHHVEITHTFNRKDLQL